MNKIELLQNYHEIIDIPIQFFKDETVVWQMPEKFFTPNPVWSDFLFLKEKKLPISYTITDGFMLVGLIRCEEAPDESIFLGPVPLSHYSSSQCLRLLHTIGETKERLDEFSRWIHSIPIYDTLHFQNILHFLDFSINHVSTKRIQYIENNDSSLLSPLEFKSTKFLPDTQQNLLTEQIFENKILSLIESGDVLELQKNIYQLFHHKETRELQGLNADRYLKNIFIGGNSLACRAAILGGVSRPVALGISDRFISEIESCRGYEEIMLFLSQMLITYAKESSASKFPKDCSLLTHKIIETIRSHIYEPLSPADIALELHMDLSYLCRHFKQQTGFTLSSYIRKTKIEESKRLLRTTNLSLVQISMQLGFSSQNYFQTVFKDVTGVTPKMYRGGDG